MAVILGASRYAATAGVARLSVSTVIPMAQMNPNTTLLPFQGWVSLETGDEIE